MIDDCNERVSYALRQAIGLYHSGSKPAAVRTFVRLLGVEQTSKVESDIRGMIYSAEHSCLERFEAHLKLFARNHVPGYSYHLRQITEA